MNTTKMREYLRSLIYTCFSPSVAAFVLIFLEWKKWNVRPSHKFSDKKTEFEESTAIIGDAGVRGSYLQEDEGSDIRIYLYIYIFVFMQEHGFIQKCGISLNFIIIIL